MYIELDDEQRQFEEVLGRLLAPYAAAGQGVDLDSLWERLIEVGIGELPGERERSIAFLAAGKACLPGLVLTSFGLALPLLEGLQQASELRQATANGDARPVPALDLDWVPDAPGATHFLVEDGDALAAVAASDCQIETLPSFDLGRPVGRVTVGGVRQQLGSIEAARRILTTRGLIAVSAELAGVAAACVDAAVLHANTRVQFDRPIGVHQAVSHRCVDMYIACEGARNQVDEAASLFDSGADAAHAGACAHVATATAAIQTAQSLIQVLGGIGFTWEHEAHRYLRRAHSTAHLVRPPKASARVIAASIYPVPIPAAD